MGVIISVDTNPAREYNRCVFVQQKSVSVVSMSPSESMFLSCRDGGAVSETSAVPPVTVCLCDSPIPVQCRCGTECLCHYAKS